MGIFTRKIGYALTVFDSRISLVLNGIALVGSAALLSWAVKSMKMFSEYAPLSWVLAGFCGILFWIILRLLWVWVSKISTKAKYDNKMIEAGSAINPLDLTFEGKRIYIADLALPSHPVIIGKTFTNCDLVGPANVYFATNNQAVEIRPPVVDGVWLDPSKDFYNGYMFINCIFRGCSFQRITIFASVENYEAWKDNQSLNWMTIPPLQEHIDLRKSKLLPVQKKPEEPQKQISVEPKNAE